MDLAQASGLPIRTVFISRPLTETLHQAALPLSIPPSVKATPLPAESATGDFSCHIPAIVLSDAQFPFPSQSSVQGIWLAVILFSQKEISAGRVRESQLSGNQLPDDLAGLAQSNIPGQVLPVLDLESKWLAPQLFPPDTLGMLQHVRQTGDSSESVVMGTRLPTEAGSYTAWLVALPWGPLRIRKTT